MTIRQKLLTAAIVSALSTHQTSPAAIITVDTTSDGAVRIGSDICTLRLAVEAANSNAGVPGCAAGSAVESDVIRFDSSLLGGTIALENSRIDIASSVTVENTSE